MGQKQKLNIIYRLIWNMAEADDCYALSAAVLRYISGCGIQEFDDELLTDALSAIIDLLTENIDFQEEKDGER